MVKGNHYISFMLNCLLMAVALAAPEGEQHLQTHPKRLRHRRGLIKIQEKKPEDVLRFGATEFGEEEERILDRELYDVSTEMMRQGGSMSKAVLADAADRVAADTRTVDDMAAVGDANGAGVKAAQGGIF